MREYEEILADAESRGPFSNGTMGRAWMEQWCETCRNDTPELVEAGDGCPLIMVAYMGRTPAEWTYEDAIERGKGNYTCVEYEPEEEPEVIGTRPPDLDPIPGQGQLFDV